MTDANHTSHANDTAVMVGDGSSSSASYMRAVLEMVLKDRTAEGGAPVKTHSSSPGDTCTWYADGQCARARTCFDCLNTFVAGSKCMVNSYGVCVGMSRYDPEDDFRRNTSISAVNAYPSTNASYCAAADKYCAPCRKNWNNPFDNSQLSYLRFCRGAGGCVCIQSCEAPYHNENVIMQRCVAYGLGAGSAKTVYTSIGIMAALCFVFAVVTVVVRRWVRSVEARGGYPHRPPGFRHHVPLPQREPSGPRLGLSGWRSMREKLIETEREQQQITINQTLTLPVMDGTTVGSAVPINAADTYLPASPSDLAARQEHRQSAITESDDDDQQLPPRSLSDPTESTPQRSEARPVTEV